MITNGGSDVFNGGGNGTRDPKLFFLANVFLVPTVGLVALMTSSVGLRALVPVMSSKLYRFSILGWLREIPYVNGVDLAEAFVAGLIVLGLFGWVRVLWTLANWKRLTKTAYFFLSLLIWVVIISADGVIFFEGLKTSSSNMSLWSGAETSEFIAMFATVLYLAIFAAIGKLHLNFFHGDQ